MHLKRKARKNHASYRNVLITFEQPKSPATEAYRTLRTNIDFFSFDKGIKALLVTSSQPDEGKTSVAANLCVVLTMVGKKVLLVDADLRMPSLHKIYNMENSTGLTSLIINASLGLSDVVQETGIKNLSLLASGPIPPNPAELLTSRRMRELTKDFKEAYDVVVVDSPPVMGLPDAAILASYLDGVIFVLGSGIVSRDQARAARDQLMKVKAIVLGVVLNKVPLKGSGYYNYYQSNH